MNRASTLLGGFALLTLSACGQPGQSPGDAPLPTSAQDDADTYEWLVGEEVPTQGTMRVQVDQDLLAESKVQDEPRYRVGLALPLDRAVDLSAVQAPTPTPVEVAGGALRANGAGGFVWSAVVEADGANALRLEIDDFHLPADAALYAYNDRGQVAGPYIADGPDADGVFPTNALRGDRVYLQLRYDGTDAAAALDDAFFEVDRVGYLDERFELANYRLPGEPEYKELCSYNAGCVENAECENLPAAIEPARSAIAEMLFGSGRWYYLCTGGLIQGADSGTDYFLTANHCISKSSEADSLETYFDYTTPCGSTDGCELNQPYNTLGASILATGSDSDFTLMALSESTGRAGLPWNNTEIAFTAGLSLYRISHPQGAPQAYSEHVVDTEKGECQDPWTRGNRIFSSDVYGATEGGSSGSPVLNANGEIVGQLSGACGTNTGDVCDSASNATVDGALANYYDQVSQYLGDGSGGGDCTDADGDGWCVEDGDCDDGDSSVNPGADEVCDDGIDNNCDGQVDEDCDTGECTDADSDGWCVEDGDCDDSDPDTYPGAEEICDDGIDNDCDGEVDEDCNTGECAVKHEACDTDADCCSGKCRGPSHNRSCK